MKIPKGWQYSLLRIFNNRACSVSTHGVITYKLTSDQNETALPVDITMFYSDEGTLI